MIHAVKKTLNRKIIPRLPKNKKNRAELKGTLLTQMEKEYFFHQLKDVDFKIFSVTINKKRSLPLFKSPQNQVYNRISQLVIDQFPFETASTTIYFYIDKSKGATGIREFNSYIDMNLKERINPKVHFYIAHRNSQNTPGIQAVDLFCNGIFKKYETNDTKWYEIFASKISFETIYGE